MIERLLFGMLIIALSACSRTPQGVLSEKKMELVLTDMLQAEAWVSLESAAYRNDTLKARAYEAVFRKHNISRAEYDSSLVWYGRNIDIYMRVYERAAARLEEQIHHLESTPPE
jgi:hypothetical protein